jgi:hypothetical protein
VQSGLRLALLQLYCELCFGHSIFQIAARQFSKLMQLLKRTKGRFDSSDILPMFAVGTLAIQVLGFALGVFNSSRISNLAHKPAPSMVQMIDGKTSAMQSVDHLDRTPDVVLTFTKSALAQMFTWNAKRTENASDAALTATPAKVLVDPGVPVGDNGKVTSSSWAVSMAWKEDFRSKFLQAVAALTPPDVFSGGAQSVLTFESVSQPKPIGDHAWQIDVVANLLVFTSSYPQGKAIPFNKSIFVDAIEPTTDPLPDQSTPIQQAVYRNKQSGLEIREMRDLDVQQFNNHQ